MLFTIAVLFNAVLCGANIMGTILYGHTGARRMSAFLAILTGGFVLTALAFGARLVI